jgi:hypothetical protein
MLLGYYVIIKTPDQKLLVSDYNINAAGAANLVPILSVPKAVCPVPDHYRFYVRKNGRFLPRS